MKPLHQYGSLKEFIDDLEKSPPHHFSFKVMGQKRVLAKKQSAIFQSASMLAEVYRSIPDPDLSGTMPVQAIFGEIFNRGCNLNAGTGTYSTIAAQPSGHNLFQGDLINYDISEGGNRFPKHRLSQILSHSCGIANTDFICLAPVYLESEIDQDVVDFFKGKKGTQNFSLIRGNWFRNENLNFIGYPTVDLYSSEGDRLLSCPNLAMTVSKKNLPTLPQLRLTYRALSYTQSRLALFFLRDVQDSDDTRDF